MPPHNFCHPGLYRYFQPHHSCRSTYLLSLVYPRRDSLLVSDKCSSKRILINVSSKRIRQSDAFHQGIYQSQPQFSECEAYFLEGAFLRLAPCGAPHPPLHHDFHEHCDQVRKHILLRAMRPNTTDSQAGGLPRKSSNAPS